MCKFGINILKVFYIMNYDYIIDLLKTQIKDELTERDKELLCQEEKHYNNIDVLNDNEKFIEKLQNDIDNSEEDNTEIKEDVEVIKEKKVKVIVEEKDVIVEKKSEYCNFIDDENIIGIDLGTTNTCVSVWKDGKFIIIPDENGNKLIPSYVAYTHKSRYIGIDAKKQKDINTNNVFYETKRLIGRKFNEASVKLEKNNLTYKIKEGNDGNVILMTDNSIGRTITPEEISGAILTKCKQIASKYLKCDVKNCVITVPANFNDNQRQATKDAATIAGLNCLRIINEPISASLAYGLLERTTLGDYKHKNILVYDLGGGTLDVSILRIENGIFSVSASCGNTRLGGTDFDNVLIGISLKKFFYTLYINNKIYENNISFDEFYNAGIKDVSDYNHHQLRLRCENAKKLLSQNTDTYIIVKDFLEDIDLNVKLSRNSLEKICQPLYMACLEPVDTALSIACLNSNDIDEVILVGGMTRMPKIKEFLYQKFKKQPNSSLDPDYAVAIGAGIQAFILSHQENAFLNNISLLDSTSLSLGVEVIGGNMEIIIPRGTTFPVRQKKRFTTSTDYETSVKIKVFEGERKMTRDNLFVGEFILNDIEHAPRGIPRITVIFDIDENGIITVSAINESNNEKTTLNITSNKGRLSQDEINKIIELSNKMEIRDELVKQKKMLWYEIDNLISHMKLNMKNKLLCLSETDIKNINIELSNIEKWLSDKNFDDRNDEEYDNMITNIKKKYSLLILKHDYSNDSNIKEKETTNKHITNSIFDLDNDEEEDLNNKLIKDKICEDIEIEELGIKDLRDINKNEVKEKRNNLILLCNNVSDILNSKNVVIKDEDKTNLLHYIDDVLMWLHISEKITLDEYEQKITDINEQCNNIFDTYDNVFVDDEIKGKVEELKQTCLILKLMFENKNISIKKNDMDRILCIIDESLEWLNDNNDKWDKEDFISECEIKLNELNEICNVINDQKQSLNINNIDIFNDIVIENNDEVGVSIIDIMKENTNKDINELIFNDD